MLEQIAGLIRSLGVEVAVTESSTLASLGLDSLNTLELVVAIEEHFGITFDDADLTAANFESVSSVLDLVQKCLVLQHEREDE